MKRILGVALLALALAPAASASQTPFGFVQWELQQWNYHRWDTLWARIHPAQRRDVDRQLYDTCNAQDASAAPVVFTRVQLVRTLDVHAAIPGTKLRQPAKRVTYRVTVKSAQGTFRVNPTLDLFLIKGKWYWALTADQIKAYRATQCPGATS